MCTSSWFDSVANWLYVQLPNDSFKTCKLPKVNYISLWLAMYSAFLLCCSSCQHCFCHMWRIVPFYTKVLHCVIRENIFLWYGFFHKLKVWFTMKNGYFLMILSFFIPLTEIKRFIAEQKNIDNFERILE